MVPALALLVHASVHDILVLVVSWREAKRRIVAVMLHAVNVDPALLIMQREVAGEDFDVRVPAIADHHLDKLSQVRKRVAHQLMQLDSVPIQDRQKELVAGNDKARNEVITEDHHLIL